MAVVPIDDVPPRFAARTLYQEDFVVAMRSGHPFARNPTLERYCGMRHLLVSGARDDHGFVDAALAEHGRSRRIAVALPNFMLALSMLAQSDLLAALPRSLVKAHGRRFGLVSREIPIELPVSALRALTTRAALNDAGVAWMFEALAQAVAPEVRRVQGK